MYGLETRLIQEFLQKDYLRGIPSESSWYFKIQTCASKRSNFNQFFLIEGSVNRFKKYFVNIKFYTLKQNCQISEL